MAEKLFSLVHNLAQEHRRDAYGFALRPQHIQRYTEYVNIYKEEEGERSVKWKNFIEQQAETAQPRITEEKYNQSLHVEASEFEEVTISQKSGEGSKAGDTELKDTTISERDSEGNKAEAAKFKKDTILANRSEEDNAEDRELKEENLSERSETSHQSEGTEGTILERGKEGDNCGATELEKDTVLKRGRERDDSSRNSNADGSTELDPRNEPLSKETKKPKVQTWTQIRPSLGAIENMMSFRVKKRKNMKSEQVIKIGNHLLSIDEVGSFKGESDQSIKEEVFVNKTSDGTESASHEKSDPQNYVFQEPYFPWKEELECLVRGGVPKDLRGEVWQAFVGVKARRVERYYQYLLDQEMKASESQEHDSSSGLSKKSRKQIEKDVPRTFPGHPALNEDGRDSLRRLLLAYARHNPSVGYCQAMNFFAGLLLLLMPEENAFWTLEGIIDDYFEGYYTEEMIESQVDQLVFEDLIRERFPRLVNHLDYLGVQVTWISGPWFLSIFVHVLPWESVLRVWDVLLYEGNRVMLFRTALALMELYGPALVTTKDAGDAITLFQSLAGSTFDSSQLVLTACMGYLTVTESRLQELRKKHRPSVIEMVAERSKGGPAWKDSKGLASKLYSFKHDPESLIKENKTTEGLGDAHGDVSHSVAPLSKGNDLPGDPIDGSEVDLLPDLQEQIVWFKVELCRVLEEKRSAVLRAEELETALMEMVQQDNRRQLSARIEQLEREVANLAQVLVDKKEQESAMLEVLLRVEQEQRITEDARRIAEQDAAAQKYAVYVLQEKYEKALASVAQMEKRMVMAESMLEATLQYESGQARAVSPRAPQLTAPERGQVYLGLAGETKASATNVEESSNGKAPMKLETEALHRKKLMPAEWEL